MQDPAWRDVLAGEAIEPRPVEPVPLASPQQSVPPSAAHLVSKAVQSQQVGRNCMVRKVAIQDPLQPRTHDRHRFVPPLVELVADRGQRCSHTLLGRQSHDLELPLLVRDFVEGPYDTLPTSKTCESMSPSLAHIIHLRGRHCRSLA
jgi:hypothetical protein